MKQLLPGIYSRAAAMLLLGLFIGVTCLSAEDKPDPTASQIPDSQLQTPTEKAPAQFNSTSPVLLISGLIGTIGGAVLCVYAVQSKDGYTNAYNAWLASPTSGNLASRDALGVQYLVPLISGIALSTTGILLTIAGISTGMGGESYQTIVPVIDKDAKVSSGLYFFVAPTQIGIALK